MDFRKIYENFESLRYLLEKYREIVIDITTVNGSIYEIKITRFEFDIDTEYNGKPFFDMKRNGNPYLAGIIGLHSNLAQVIKEKPDISANMNLFVDYIVIMGGGNQFKSSKITQTKVRFVS